MAEPRVATSKVCADPKTAGQRHYGCSGGICICPCHGVRLRPGQLRARVEQQRAERAAERTQDGSR